MAESLLVRRNFASGICKLKPKNPYKNARKPKKPILKTRFLPALSRVYAVQF